jgi:hypothetical protein
MRSEAMKIKLVNCQTCGAHVSTQSAEALCPHCASPLADASAANPLKSLLVSKSNTLARLLGVSLAVSVSATSIGCSTTANDVYGGPPIEREPPSDDMSDDADSADESEMVADKPDPAMVDVYGAPPIDE